MAESEGQKKPTAPVIRTMRDDLQDARRVQPQAKQTYRSPLPPPPPVPSPQGIGKVPVRPPATVPAPVSAGGGVPAPPLAPKLPTSLEGFAPMTAKRKRDPILLVLLAVFAVAGIAAAGVWAWIFFQPSGPVEENAEIDATPKTLEEVIPADSLLVAHYVISSPEERALLEREWSVAGDNSPTMQQTLTGDIRLLLAQPGIDEFAYVLLPGDPRFYLVVEGAKGDQFLAQYTNAQVGEISQWRVVHSFDTAPFTQSLASGSFASTGRQLAAGQDGPLQISLQGELLTQLHEKAALFFGDESDIQLHVSYAQEVPGLVRFDTGTGIDVPVPVDMSALLARVPPDASLIRLGEDFSSQSFRVTSAEATQFTAALTGPYAYYERTGSDGSSDAGVVIQMPPEAVPTIVVPSQIIENALPALVAAAGLGDVPASQIAFVDSVYNETPLRYVNINTPQLALDYAVTDDFLLLATSKEGMFALLDQAGGLPSQTPALEADKDWATLEEVSSELGGNKVLGLITQPAIRRLFPGGEAHNSLMFAATYDGSQPTSFVTSGILVLPQQQIQ